MSVVRTWLVAEEFQGCFISIREIKAEFKRQNKQEFRRAVYMHISEKDLYTIFRFGESTYIL